MPVSTRPAAWCAAALLLTGCSHTVTGVATRAIPGIDDDSRSPVDVETVMLDQSQMRAITGAGEELSIIPSMDAKSPVDIELLADTAPPQCRWFFAETQVFGPDVEEFHKTTFQHPPKGGLISQAAAAYRTPEQARGAFTDLVAAVQACHATDHGSLLVGDWDATADALTTRAGACGRDYRVKSVVLAEVTFCRFPASAPELVLTNILKSVPE
ncbi:hypothetical protein MHAS_00920 [Mycolicibacterium hassiacum DSM 44199]|jgi:hypothetical protein|uniref:sensor domain-containing protein n=1 Tax=Mycolicibacterium hassiacum TaxID=46351 RepID=UPI000305A70A|nr:sensor domain-containing protein [Mycolicibacterium hassiacum]MBX5487037.1 sensor domain-containing protein [Mycolicibacterium hassiacum]MDA4085232.1 hypothetical protein [Mycolicibacterium hassiacum DSM 44199]VCT89233.1 hypothetical protein MHAS_00920 [Mycolicibacterium hassiacum DSM 44199]